ncbi:MAG: type VI secretion system contractile sheath small subunit, partial [Polyangiaceae bacterium]
PLEERLPVRFDRDTFGKVLAAHAPRLDVTVTSADAHTVRATLGFRSLADFGPDAIAEQIPEVQRLLSVRDALTDLKSTGDVGAFRAALGALSLGPAEHARLLASLGLEGA